MLELFTPFGRCSFFWGEGAEGDVSSKFEPENVVSDCDDGW